MDRKRRYVQSVLPKEFEKQPLAAVLSLVVSGVPRIREWLRGRRLRKNEVKLATAALDELKGFILKFLEFSSTANSDTFYGLVFSPHTGSGTPLLWTW